LEVRLRDLVPEIAAAPTAARVLVRSPTLLETTAVFQPYLTGRSASYRNDDKQVLRRVRDYTKMGERNAGLEAHVATVGDPRKTPFAIFGLPSATSEQVIASALEFERFQRFGLDAIVVDATRAGLSEQPEAWEKTLEIFLHALPRVGGRRPPVVALTDEAFSLQRVSRVLRKCGTSLKPRRKAALEIGAYLPEPGVLGPQASLPAELPPLRFDADIKDASLAVLRQALVKLGRDLKTDGDIKSANGVSQALALLRRAANLPIGLAEARSIADIIYDDEDEEDQAARTLFRPKVILGPLAAVQIVSPSHGASARALLSLIEDKLTTWDNETPISLKLAALLAEPAWAKPSTVVSIMDQRVLDVYLSSDRVVASRCIFLEHGSLAAWLNHNRSERMIVVGPNPAALTTLLTTQATPDRVALLGDAGGSALLAATLAPIARISAFAPMANRAKDLITALRRGGSDERLDISESEFRVAATIPERDIDFTRSGDAYAGEIIRLRTSGDHSINYRPSSDVLSFSAGEIRPFQRVAARDVQLGDRILVLKDSVREPLRRALAGSRNALVQLQTYHEHIRKIRQATPGSSLADKARFVLREMQKTDASIGDSETPNIVRWLSADEAPISADGARQPRAARDERRFKVFMAAVGVDAVLADLYWHAAILVTRAYRAHEGYLFNQRVVQFILDPEGVLAGTGDADAIARLWSIVLDAVDDVTAIERLNSDNG
jgi:hypothetical protein